MKITLSSVVGLVLAMTSVTFAAPAKHPGKGHPALSADAVAGMKRLGWLPSNYTAPIGGFGPALKPLEPTSIEITGPVEGPSPAPSKSRNSRGPANYICPGAKVFLTWRTRQPFGKDSWKNAEHDFEILVTSNPAYERGIGPAKSKGSAPNYLETVYTHDGLISVTHDGDWETGKLSLSGNGQTARWELINLYSYDYDSRYQYATNEVNACLNWRW
ncbi:hypothetical protein EC991_003307 [Linnemannia zychae]|nr:hypothetical protein EC991_003307 [Linnemannia zychae]